jgi:hypothetical protein
MDSPAENSGSTANPVDVMQLRRLYNALSCSDVMIEANIDLLINYFQSLNESDLLLTLLLSARSHASTNLYTMGKIGVLSKRNDRFAELKR